MKPRSTKKKKWIAPRGATIARLRALTAKISSYYKNKKLKR
jgi:hypothetical protein